MRELRILLSGGGTAGHVLPHIAVLKALEKIGKGEKSTRETREGEVDFLSKKFTSMTAAEKVAQVIMGSVKSRNENKENRGKKKCGGSALRFASCVKFEKFSKKVFLYLGSKTGPEKALAEQWGIPYQAIETGKWRRYLDFENIALNVRDLFRIQMGFFQAFLWIRRFKPDVIFSKGGYVSVPVLFAGWVLRVPIVIHDSDAIPGMTTRIVARFAKCICLGYTEAQSHLPAKFHTKIVVTGVPIREEILKGTRAQGLKKSGLKGEKPIVLIMGGSLGAERINNAVREALPELLKKVEILHITGRGKSHPDASLIPVETGIRCPVPMQLVLDHNRETGDNVIPPNARIQQAPRTKRSEVRSPASCIPSSVAECPIPHFLKILDSSTRENKAEGADNHGYRQIEYANEDLADFYAMSDLIVSRAGANSIAEIEALNKPAILIPLGGKVSHGDQLANARLFHKQGKGIILAEEGLNGGNLKKFLAMTLFKLER